MKGNFENNIQYDIDTINRYLVYLGFSQITEDDVRLELAISSLATTYSDCVILDVNVAIACIIAVMEKQLENEDTSANGSSSGEKIGTASKSTGTSTSTTAYDPTNTLAYELLMSQGLDCGGTNFTIGIAANTKGRCPFF